MKKIILATLILVALTVSASAGEKHSDKKLLDEALKANKTWSSVTNSTANEDISLETFHFNGKVVSAYYQDGNELIGYSIPSSQSELPVPVVSALAKKYSGWNIANVILFIDDRGNANYFLEIHQGNNGLVIKAALEGSIGIYSKINY